MSSELQLDVRHLNLWCHLVNAQEEKAGMVFFAGLTVWSMPERFKVVCIRCKALYKCYALLLLLLCLSMHDVFQIHTVVGSMCHQMSTIFLRWRWDDIDISMAHITTLSSFHCRLFYMTGFAFSQSHFLWCPWPWSLDLCCRQGWNCLSCSCPWRSNPCPDLGLEGPVLGLSFVLEGLVLVLALSLKV